MLLKKNIMFMISFSLFFMFGCSGHGKTSSNLSYSQLAEPFRPIAGELMKNVSNPIYLPAYLPSPYQGKEWLLKCEPSKNKFTIEIDQRSPGFKDGMYAGTLFGNIGHPPESPLEKQFMSESREVKTINLPSGIEGKEYIIDPVAGKAISWKIGQWSYFVVAQPDNEEGSTIDYASKIINIIGGNGLALSDYPGKLYFLYPGTNHPTTEIYWKVNDSVWYQLNWRDDPNNAIKILRSMKYIGSGRVK